MQGPGGPSRKRASARLLRARDPAGDRCLAGLGQKRVGPVRVPLGGHVAVRPQRADANEKRPPGPAWEQTYKHRARDALGLVDLRHALPFRSNQSGRRAHRTSTSLDVARRRGPRVQLDPWRPARPRFFFRVTRIFPHHDGVPGAAKKQGGGALPNLPKTKSATQRLTDVCGFAAEM